MKTTLFGYRSVVSSALRWPDDNGYRAGSVVLKLVRKSFGGIDQAAIGAWRIEFISQLAVCADACQHNP